MTLKEADKEGKKKKKRKKERAGLLLEERNDECVYTVVMMKKSEGRTYEISSPQGMSAKRCRPSLREGQGRAASRNMALAWRRERQQGEKKSKKKRSEVGIHGGEDVAEEEKNNDTSWQQEISGENGKSVLKKERKSCLMDFSRE